MSEEISLLGKLKEKLIQRKQEWARDGRLLTGNQSLEDRDSRLPRGQRLVTDWPVLDLSAFALYSSPPRLKAMLRP